MEPPQSLPCKTLSNLVKNGGDNVAIMRLSYKNDEQLQKVLETLGNAVISCKVSKNSKGEFKKAYIKLNI